MKETDRLESLVDALKCLPGVGPKSALRLAYYLLQRNRKGAKNLSDSITDALEQLGNCKLCNNFSEEEICNMNENYDEIVIIGGGYLFRDTLSITNKLVLTNVDCDIEGDVFYPEINLNEWKEIKSENFKKDLDNDYDFVVRIYERA